MNVNLMSRVNSMDFCVLFRSKTETLIWKALNGAFEIISKKQVWTDSLGILVTLDREKVHQKKNRFKISRDQLPGNPTKISGDSVTARVKFWVLESNGVKRSFGARITLIMTHWNSLIPSFVMFDIDILDMKNLFPRNWTY